MAPSPSPSASASPHPYQMLDPPPASFLPPSLPTLADLASSLLLLPPPQSALSLPCFASTSTSTSSDPSLVLETLLKRSWDQRSEESGSEDGDTEVDEMEDDPKKLKDELKRVRKQLRREKSARNADSSASGAGGGSNWEGERGAGRERGQTTSSSTTTVDTSFHRLATPTSLVSGSVVGEESLHGDDEEEEEEDLVSSVAGGSANKKKERKRGEHAKRNEGNGKREIKERKVALNKSIRNKLRQLMGIEEKDPFPDPDDPGGFDDEGNEFIRPNWRVSITNGHNKRILEQVVSQVLDEAWTSLRDPERGIPRTEISEEDLDKGVALKAAKTSFVNFGKKFLAQTDPVKKDHLERDGKRRRRWARKDLKQKRRLKAASDPNYTSHTYPNLLRIDYMSSEYSSEGEPEDPKDKMPEGLWDEVAGKPSGGSAAGGEESEVGGGGGSGTGGAKGKGKGRGGSLEDKILEVRTPRWRSGDLNAVYTDLDRIAACQLKVTKGKMHSMPSHTRFKLNPLRDLPPPFEAIQPWEFDPAWLAAEGKANGEARGRTSWATTTTEAGTTMEGGSLFAGGSVGLGEGVGGEEFGLGSGLGAVAEGEEEFLTFE